MVVDDEVLICAESSQGRVSVELGSNGERVCRLKHRRIIIVECEFLVNRPYFDISSVLLMSAVVLYCKNITHRWLRIGCCIKVRVDFDGIDKITTHQVDVVTRGENWVEEWQLKYDLVLSDLISIVHQLITSTWVCFTEGKWRIAILDDDLIAFCENSERHVHLEISHRAIGICLRLIPKSNVA